MHAVMCIVFKAQSDGVCCGPLSVVVDNKLYCWHNIAQHPRQKTAGKKKKNMNKPSAIEAGFYSIVFYIKVVPLHLSTGVNLCSHLTYDFAFASTSPSSFTLCEWEMSRMGSDPVCAFVYAFPLMQC